MFTRIIINKGSEEDEVKVKTGVIKKIESGYSKFKKLITSSVEGQMEEENIKDSPIHNMSSQNLLSRIVGHPNESKIFMNGLETRALIETGSMVTCLSKKFYQSLRCKPKLHDIQDFELKVYSADGNSLPFSGFVEV